MSGQARPSEPAGPWQRVSDRATGILDDRTAFSGGRPVRRVRSACVIRALRRRLVSVDRNVSDASGKVGVGEADDLDDPASTNLNLLVSGLPVAVKPAHAKIRRRGYRRLQ